MKLLSGNESGHDGILPPEGAAGFCQFWIRQSVQVGGPAFSLKETLSVRGEGSDGGGLRNDRKAGDFPHPAQQCPAGLISGQDPQVRDGGGQLGGGQAQIGPEDHPPQPGVSVALGFGVV